MMHRINPHYGRWHVGAAEAEPDLDAHKGLRITKFAHSAMGGIKNIFKDPEKNIEGSYRIVSWNVATLRDYSNLRSLHNNMKEGREFFEAYQKTLNDAVYQATPQDIDKRERLFKKAFLRFENPDILCLQETAEMGVDDFQKILPDDYSFFSYENRDGKECTIVWNSTKFTKIDHADLSYDAEYISSINSSPDTIALLRDADKTLVCVASAHLRGFSLNYEALEETLKQQQLRAAAAGDHQTEYDLETMKRASEADVYVFAGDFNATPQHYPPRFNIIQRHGYITDGADTDPTIYDANLKEADEMTPTCVKLDYIFAKGREKVQVRVQQLDLQRTDLGVFNRPSDHLPVAAQVQFSYQTGNRN